MVCPAQERRRATPDATTLEPELAVRVSSNRAVTTDVLPYIFQSMIVAGVTIARPKSLMRIAAVLVAIAQMVVGVAPLLEADGRNANPHIETQGIQLHHAHDETSCVACISHRILGGAEPTRLPPILAVAKLHGDVVALSARAFLSPRHLRNSRAPPQTTQNDA
jgi:hypothetical protein